MVTSGGRCSPNLLQNDVVIISGNEARNFFFKCESLTYLEGYFLLVSTAPLSIADHSAYRTHRQHPNMKYLMPESYTEGKDGFGWLLKQFAHTDVLKHCERPFTFACTIHN